MPFDDPEHTSFSRIAFDSDRSRIATVWCTGPAHVFAGPCDGWLSVYEVATGEPATAPTRTAQLAPWVGSAIAWSADDAWLATGHSDGFGSRSATPTTFGSRPRWPDLVRGGDGFVTEVGLTDASAPRPLIVATLDTDAATWSVPAWERLGRSRVGVTAHFAPEGGC